MLKVDGSGVTSSLGSDAVHADASDNDARALNRAQGGSGAKGEYQGPH